MKFYRIWAIIQDTLKYHTSGTAIHAVIVARHSRIATRTLPHSAFVGFELLSGGGRKGVNNHTKKKANDTLM